MKKIYWIAGIVIAILGVTGYFLLVPRPDASAAIDTSQAQLVSIESGILEATVSATGNVRAEQSTILVWETSGKVETVNVSIGTEVSDGEILATLAQTSLPQNVILAEADLITAQQNLEDLLNSADSLAIAEAELSLANAQEQLDEAQEDWDTINFVGTQEDIDSASHDLQQAYDDLKEAEVKRNQYDNPNSRQYKMADMVYKQAYNVYATALGEYNYQTGQTVDVHKKSTMAAELAVAELELIKAQEALDDVLKGVSPDEIAASEAKVAAAKANLKAAWIEAPFNGTITDVSALPGDLVNQNEQAFILNNLETLLIDLEISEIDINQIEVGQQVQITFDAIPVTQYEGVVVGISMDGIETAGVIDFPVVVKITNPDEQIRLGMTAAVDIIVIQKEIALLIPNQAIRVEEGIQVVYQLVGDNLVAVPVVLGFSSNTYSEVIQSNLKDGDQIILNPSIVLNQSNELDMDELREMNGGENNGGPGALFGGE